MESRISSVVVYNDRAMITRVMETQVSDGNQIVSFEGLPATLLEQSVRVSGKGSARIVGLDLKSQFLEHAPGEAVRTMESEILKLQDEVAGLDLQSTVFASQRNFLESIRVGYAERISKELSAEPPAPGDLERVLKFLGKALAELLTEDRKLAVQRRDLSARLDALRKQLDQIRGQGKKESRSAEVALEALAAGPVQLELSYVVTGANWKPVYDARLPEDGKTVEIACRGIVTQLTGEDWNDADLALSTAQPSISADVPELSPWHVTIFVRRPHPKTRAGAPVPAGRPMQQAAFDAEATMSAAPSMAVGAAHVEEQTASVVLHVPRKAVIPSDGMPYSQPVGLDILSAQTEYICVPKLSQFVYLRSRITNTAPYPFLSGDVNLFLGSNFVGNATLPVIARQEEFDLSFGVDESIKVKREEKRSHKDAGILGKNRMSYRYLMELQSFKKEEIKITLLDQIPVSQNDEVKVKLVDASPEPVEKKEDGTLKWQVVLKPQEKRAISFECNVEYPKDQQVAGL